MLAAFSRRLFKEKTMTVKSGATIFERAGEEISLSQAMLFVLDNVRLVIYGLVLGLIGAFIIILMLRPVYHVESTIRVKPEKTSEASFRLSEQTSASDPSIASAEIQVIRSLAIVKEAVSQVNADILISPKRIPILGAIYTAFSPDNPKQRLANLSLVIPSYGWGGEHLEVKQLELPEALANRDVHLVAKKDGEYAAHTADGQLIGNGRVGELLSTGEYKLLVTELLAHQGMEFIVTKEDLTATALRHQKKLVLDEVGIDTGIIAISLDSDNPDSARRFIDKLIDIYVERNAERAGLEAGIYLDFIKSQLPDIEQKVNASELALNHYRQVIQSVDITLEVPAILNRLVELDSQLSKLKLKQAELAMRFTSEHPAFQMVKGQVEAVMAERDRTAEKLSTLPDTQQELVRLTRDLKVNNELYVTMLNRVQELEVSHKSAIGNVAVVDKAYYDAKKPTSPNKSLTLLISALVGALCGIVYAIVRKSLNPGVSRCEEFEQLGIDVYAAIPITGDLVSAPGKSKRHANQTTLAAQHPANPAIEAIRTLRASLHFAMAASNAKVVMVTGPTMGVGKSFVSSNLATVCAQAGKRVLLIDADMRRGSLHEQFGVEAGPGLADRLGRKIETDAILKTSSAGVYLLTRGTPPDFPSELLMSELFEKLISSEKDKFDLIIIDTPPLLAVADASIIGRISDMNLLVSRFEYTSVAEIKECQSRLRQSGLKLSGAVINAVEQRHSVGYGKAYQAYSYGTA